MNRLNLLRSSALNILRNNQNQYYHFSNKKTIKSPLLARDFIYDRLYNSDSGYFCKDDLQIGEMKQPINFKELLGYEEYQRQLSEYYPENAWLTPSEIFKPYYGMSIANYMQQTIEKMKQQYQEQQLSRKNNSYTAQAKPFDDKIRIVEIGAGQASAAQSILMYFKNYEQSYYANLEYTIVEISPQMCKKALEKLSRDHSKLIERGQIKFINEDFVNFKPQNRDQHHFLLFLEVLDNMPHDRIYKKKNAQEDIWEKQALVEFTDEFGNEGLKEVLTDIKDPLIQEFINILKTVPTLDHIEEEKNIQGGIIQNVIRWLFKQPKDNMFIPTFCLKVLKHINSNIPNHNVIFADFDMLKTAESAKMGINAPIVSQKLSKSHEKKDFSTYLVQRGQADIFFPTDFRLLSHLYKQVCNKKGKALKSYQFMDIYSKEKWAETKSGYNPLKEDFENTSFFITDVERNK
ncbi:hypothetical protein ABPG74_006167 [Tetrahymena malaccensis]